MRNGYCNGRYQYPHSQAGKCKQSNFMQKWKYMPYSTIPLYHSYNLQFHTMIQIQFSIILQGRHFLEVWVGGLGAWGLKPPNPNILSGHIFRNSLLVVFLHPSLILLSHTFFTEWQVHDSNISLKVREGGHYHYIYLLIWFNCPFMLAKT